MKETSKQYTPKDILDRYRPMIVFSDAVFEKNGVSQVNSSKKYRYNPEKYNGREVLMIAPKDCIRLEFEDEPAKNFRYIQELEDAARAKGFQFCITAHEGCKSPYFNMFNIEGIPVNEDNILAKELLIDMILPTGAKQHLDKTNYKWTLSPVIGHPHWKKKYGGAIHKIISGVHPLEQKNKYPRELLKKIKKIKSFYKHERNRVKKDAPWVEDFLLNYCTSNALPGGERHFVIEKNLAAFLIDRADKNEIISQYLATQGRTHNTLKTWFDAIRHGKYTQVSASELRKYIRDYDIDYTVPAQNNKKQEQQAQQAQQVGGFYSLHPGGGIIHELSLIFEPIGGYRYLYKYRDERGIALAHFNKDTNRYYLDFDDVTFPFDGKPIDKVLFAVPSKQAISEWINGRRRERSAAEIFQDLVQYFEVLYDVADPVFLKIAAIGQFQSWVLPALNAVFYLGFSAKYGGGKTAFLEGIAQVSRHGCLTGNISGAAVARLAERYQLSLMADEIDVKSQSKDNEVYLLFRQGYKRGNFYVRLAGDSSSGYEPDIFDPFGFKACTFHDDIEKAFRSRTFVIPLRTSNDTALPILNLYKRDIGQPLFEDLFFWQMDNLLDVVASVASPKIVSNSSMMQQANRLENGLVADVADVAQVPGVSVGDIRQKMLQQLVTDFSREQVELLKKYFGRVEELLYIALRVANIVGVDLQTELKAAFDMKKQEAFLHSESYTIQALSDLLVEKYNNVKGFDEHRLNRGAYAGCVFVKKADVYEDFRLALRSKDVRPPDVSTFNGYLKELGFDENINIRRERFEGHAHPMLALIFDSVALRALGLEDEADRLKQPEISDYGTTEET